MIYALNVNLQEWEERRKKNKLPILGGALLYGVTYDSLQVKLVFDLYVAEEATGAQSNLSIYTRQDNESDCVGHKF